MKTEERYDVAIAAGHDGTTTAPSGTGMGMPIVTDIAVIEVTDKGLVLKEVAPGWTPEEVQALTEPKLTIAPDLHDIELA